MKDGRFGSKTPLVGGQSDAFGMFWPTRWLKSWVTTAGSCNSATSAITARVLLTSWLLDALGYALRATRYVTEPRLSPYMPPK